jgi:hypothetical protein
VKHHDAFIHFVEAVRKNQPFLRKATEKELEGIFSRLSPAERRVYTEPSVTSKPEKKRVSEASSTKPVKAVKSSVDDFIEDEDSDDVSLVSESDLDLGDEPERLPQAVTKKHKKEHHAKVSSSVAGVKKFTWT